MKLYLMNEKANQPYVSLMIDSNPKGDDGLDRRDVTNIFNDIETFLESVDDIFQKKYDDSEGDYYVSFNSIVDNTLSRGHTYFEDIYIYDEDDEISTDIGYYVILKEIIEDGLERIIDDGTIEIDMGEYKDWIPVSDFITYSISIEN